MSIAAAAIAGVDQLREALADQLREALADQLREALADQLRRRSARRRPAARCSARSASCGAELDRTIAPSSRSSAWSTAGGLGGGDRAELEILSLVATRERRASGAALSLGVQALRMDSQEHDAVAVGSARVFARLNVRGDDHKPCCKR